MAFYAGVVFDCDGTLIDSEGIHQTVFDAVSRKHNLGSRDPRKHIGLSLSDLWGRIGGTDHATLTFAQWAQDIEAFYAHKPCNAPLRPHVLPTLEALFQRGVPLACASNAQKNHVHLSLEGCGVGRFFDAVLGREDATFPKPHPEIYLKACKRLKLAPSDCLAVEDSAIGVQSAKAAGMTVIAFPHADVHEADLGQADFVVRDVRQALAIMGFNVRMDAVHRESRASAMAI